MPRYKNDTQVRHLDAEYEDLNAADTSVLKPQQILSMASVTAALGKLLIDNQFRQDIKYKHQFADPANDNDELQDIFSGSVYRDLRNREVIQKNDFCLLMMVDGFQNKKSLKNASTLVHCMMMTTSTDNR